MKLQFRMPGDRFEIAIRMQHLHIAAHGNSSDQAVIERADRLAGSATPPKEAGGQLEIAESLNCDERAATEQPSQLLGVRLVTPTCEDLHHDNVGRVQRPLRFD